MPISILSKLPGPWYRRYHPRVLLKVAAETLNAADLRNARLSYASLAAASLEKACLDGADLTAADLSGARLNSATLVRATLDSADLAGTLLITTDLSEASLEDANLWGANLSGTNATAARFAGANLMTARLSAGNFRGASFRNANLTQLLARGANLAEVDFRQATLKEANLSNARLGQALFASAKLVAADLSLTDAEGADFTRAQARGANFNEALLDHATMRHVGMSHATAQLANMQHAVADQANFDDADLYGANLDHCSARDARFTRCGLSRSNLSHGDFTSATFESADLSAAYLEAADLTGANLSGCQLTGANLRGSVLARANLWGAELTGCDLSGANLTDATLMPGQLDDAVIDDATQLPTGFDPPASRPRDVAPERPQRSERLLLRGHHAPVVAFATTPDGHLLLSGDRAGQLVLWDLTTGQVVEKMVVGSAVRDLRIVDAHHAIIAARHRPGDRGELVCFDLLAWRTSAKQTVPSEVRCVTTIPHSEQLLLSGESGVAIWVPEEQIAALPEASGECHACVVTSSGRLAVALQAAGVRIYDLQTRQPPRILEIEDAICLVATVAEEVVVAVESGKLIRIDAAQGQTTGKVDCESTPRCLAYSAPRDQLLYAGSDHRVRLLGARDGIELGVDDHNHQPIHRVDFLRDAASADDAESPATIITAGHDHMIRVSTMG